MSPENFLHDKLTAPNPQPVSGALPCDAYHHYYHYQSSMQYLWLARVCFLLGEQKGAEEAIKKALFQDHFNEEALAIRARGNVEGVGHSYSKHPLLDAEFCKAVARQTDAATTLHDEAVMALLAGDAAKASVLFAQAVAQHPTHSNSHFWLGKCRMLEGDVLEAKALLLEAIRLAHGDHDAYHRSASDAHVARARAFLKAEKIDLAINDYSKALDLHRGNETAMKEREAAQKAKQKY